MGLFNKKNKKIIAEISKKNKTVHEDIEKEIKELLDDLKHDFQENKLIMDDFCLFINEISDRLSDEEVLKINTYLEQVSKMKRCAKKGIEALHYLSREQQKLTRELHRETEEFNN